VYGFKNLHYGPLELHRVFRHERQKGFASIKFERSLETRETRKEGEVRGEM